MLKHDHAEDADIVIIGAGAAGLMAAIFAGRSLRESGREARVLALDGAARIGAKILISGGGRCNVTHDVVTSADFFGGSRNAVAKVLRSFTVEQVIDFFSRLGVRLKREATGKLFPVSDRARDVVDALLAAVGESGVELRTDSRVTSVSRVDGLFRIASSRGALSSRAVILATGGKSVPKTGSDGAGYQFARALGHDVTPAVPALVPLLLPQGHWLTDLSGVSLEAELSLLSGDGRLVRRERGAMLLTHFGLSGPVVLDISRHVETLSAQDGGNHPLLRANLLPGNDERAIEEQFLAQAKERPRLTVRTLVGYWLPERLAGAVTEQLIGDRANDRIGQLSRDSRRALLRGLTSMSLPVTGTRGFNYAEVTAGGVPLDQIDPSTMASRVTPGLYLCGEILDVDGRIGGYNFQWAWASGRLAGMAAVRQLPSG